VSKSVKSTKQSTIFVVVIAWAFKAEIQQVAQRSESCRTNPQRLDTQPFTTVQTSCMYVCYVFIKRD